MMEISFREFRTGVLELIDLDTVPPRIMKDYVRRNDNLQKKRPLCCRCDGTGNEFYRMYHRCPKCQGRGFQQ